jgi:hypothetical protein
VITELGSNHYGLLPIIASLSGAKSVITLTRDSSYGKSKDIIDEFHNLKNKFGLRININTKTTLLNEDYEQAHIITNSNFLRPLNKEKLSKTKQKLVIPLMYDAWELRKGDVDIEYCTKNKIRVVGTNESTSRFPIFDYCGLLAMKMAFEAGYEIKENKIVVWSDDPFGYVIKTTFESLGAKVFITNKYEELKTLVEEVDFIFISDYYEKKNYSEVNGFFDLIELKKINRKFGIIHLYGELDYSKIIELGIPCYPKKNGFANKMTFTLGHIGIIPFVKLIAGSFKVAQCALTNEKHDLVQPINFELITEKP